MQPRTTTCSGMIGTRRTRKKKLPYLPLFNPYTTRAQILHVQSELMDTNLPNAAYFSRPE
jgi:hypothetical protein